MTDYGSLIKEAREKAGLTQEELGKAIGVTGVTIMRYEKGQRNPSSKVIGEIAKVLGTDFAISVIEEVDNSLSKAMDRKKADDDEMNARRDQIMKAWKAAESKEGRKLTFDEAMDYYRIDIAIQQRIDSAIMKLNNEGRRIAAERLEELTEIPKYTMPEIPPETKKPPEGHTQPTDGK